MPYKLTTQELRTTLLPVPSGSWVSLGTGRHMLLASSREARALCQLAGLVLVSCQALSLSAQSSHPHIAAVLRLVGSERAGLDA